MREISLELLKEADDATVERIAQKCSKQPDDALFERAYQGYLVQSGYEKAHISGTKRHWAQMIGVAACCILIIGATCFVSLPPHHLPSIQDSAAETEISEVESAFEVVDPTETEFQDTTSSPVESSDHSFFISTETDIQDSFVSTDSEIEVKTNTEKQTEPYEPTQEVKLVDSSFSETEDVPNISDTTMMPSDDYEPSTIEIAIPDPTEPTNPSDLDYDTLPGFVIKSQDNCLEITYLNNLAASPEQLWMYTLNSESFYIINTMDLGSELRTYWVQWEEGSSPIRIQQLSRTQFCNIVNGESLIQKEDINEKPGYFVLGGQNDTSSCCLYWDDGYYSFAIEDIVEHKQAMLDISKALAAIKSS